MFNTKSSSVFQSNRFVSGQPRAGRPGAPAPAAKREPRERGVILEVILRFFFFVWLVFKVTALSAAVFGAATYVSYTVISREISRKEIPVPNVTGLPLAEAGKALQQQGEQLDLKGRELSIKVDEYVLSNDVRQGEIVSQFPLESTIVKAGSVVRVKVSKGSALETVPDVRGKDLTDARSDLLRAKLAVGGQTYMPHATNKRDTVMAQDPAPGEMIQKGAPVQMLVSAGPAEKLIPMPKIVGLTVAEANNLVVRRGFSWISDKREIPSSEATGSIVSQSPPEGASVPNDVKISVEISKGAADPGTAAESTPAPDLAPPAKPAGKPNEQ
jgi:serine/threonine-protein kinase